MLQKETVDLFFNLGGNGLLAGSDPTYPALVGTFDNSTTPVIYDLTGKFATLEIEVYDVSLFEYPQLTGSYSETLTFQTTDTSTIYEGSAPRQNTGTISLAGGITDQVDFNLVDQYGYSIISVPVQYFSSSVDGATAQTDTIEIGNLPILQGSILINPAETQPIYQSYGEYGLSTEFTFTATNAQGSTFATTPTTAFQFGDHVLTADVSLNISLGAVNDGASIFGTYVTPQVFTYPDGSTIPSQKQVWTI